MVIRNRAVGIHRFVIRLVISCLRGVVVLVLDHLPRVDIEVFVYPAVVLHCNGLADGEYDKPYCKENCEKHPDRALAYFVENVHSRSPPLLAAGVSNSPLFLRMYITTEPMRITAKMTAAANSAD